MKAQILNDESNIIEEVRVELFRFIEECQNLFSGQGDIKTIEKYHHPDFIYYYANNSTDNEVIKHNKEEQMEDFEYVAKEYSKIGGISMSIPWYRILIRSSNEAIISYEICQSGPTNWDRAFYLQVWKKENRMWKILREFDEQEGRTNPSAEQLVMNKFYSVKKEIYNEYKKHLPTIISKLVSNGENNKKNRDFLSKFEIYDGIKHIEVLSKDKGIICYNVSIYQREKYHKCTHFIIVDYWKRTKNKWFIDNSSIENVDLNINLTECKKSNNL